MSKLTIESIEARQGDFNPYQYTIINGGVHCATKFLSELQIGQTIEVKLFKSKNGYVYTNTIDGVDALTGIPGEAKVRRFAR